MATGIQALIYTGKLDAAGQEFMLLIGCGDLGSGRGRRSTRMR